MCYTNVAWHGPWQSYLKFYFCCCFYCCIKPMFRLSPEAHSTVYASRAFLLWTCATFGSSKFLILEKFSLFCAQYSPPTSDLSRTCCLHNNSAHLQLPRREEAWDQGPSRGSALLWPWFSLQSSEEIWLQHWHLLQRCDGCKEKLCRLERGWKWNKKFQRYLGRCSCCQ